MNQDKGENDQKPAGGEDGPRQPPYEEFVWSEIDKRLEFAKNSPDVNFDPRTATPEQLDAFKLPSRPDPQRNPRAFANWQRAMSPPLRFIAPADPKELFRVSPLSRQLQLQSTVGPTQAISNNWSGAYIRDDEGEVYQRIQGSWIVPLPYPPPPAAAGGDWLPGTSVATAWIGLDGCDPGSLSMPQIGTYQEVLVDHATTAPIDLHPSVNAWWQWWQMDDSGHQVDIPPDVFPLQVGDLVYAELEVKSANTVRFFLKNLSLGTVFPPFDLEPPTPSPSNPNFPVTVEGRTAEWIVERQTKVGTTDLRPFCDYGAVLFFGCNAVVTTNAGVTEDRQLQLATTIRLADWGLPTPDGVDQPGVRNPGIIVSSASVQGDEALLVSYTGDTP